MVVGLGMDLVEIARMRAFQTRWSERGLGRIFSPTELAYCLGHVDAGPSLAARFAAKEAFFKATGAGWGPGGDWVEVEVAHREGGAPELRLAGRAARTAAALGTRRIHVTLTHARSTAGAVVILEG